MRTEGRDSDQYRYCLVCFNRVARAWRCPVTLRAWFAAVAVPPWVILLPRAIHLRPATMSVRKPLKTVMGPVAAMGPVADLSSQPKVQLTADLLVELGRGASAPPVEDGPPTASSGHRRRTLKRGRVGGTRPLAVGFSLPESAEHSAAVPPSEAPSELFSVASLDVGPTQVDIVDADVMQQDENEADMESLTAPRGSLSRPAPSQLGVTFSADDVPKYLAHEYFRFQGQLWASAAEHDDPDTAAAASPVALGVSHWVLASLIRCQAMDAQETCAWQP